MGHYQHASDITVIATISTTTTTFSCYQLSLVNFTILASRSLFLHTLPGPNGFVQESIRRETGEACRAHCCWWWIVDSAADSEGPYKQTTEGLSNLQCMSLLIIVQKYDSGNSSILALYGCSGFMWQNLTVFKCLSLKLLPISSLQCDRFFSGLE